MSKTSKSEEIADEFIKLRTKYLELDKKYDKLSYGIYPWELNGNKELLKINNEKEAINKKISILVEKLYNTCINDNFYFFDCPFSVYKNTYNDRLSKFLSFYIDADEVDFLKNEMNNLYFKLSVLIKGYDYSLFLSDSSIYDFSLTKKKKYTEDKLLKLGYQVEGLFEDADTQYGEVIFSKVEPQKSIDIFDSNAKNNFTFEKDKSLEYNLSKLTIFPTVTYESGELEKITVDIILNQKFITDISELKSIIIEKIFSEIKTLEANYKYIFATKLYDNLKFKIEAIHKQIQIVKDNFLKADDYVIDILTLSLTLNEDIYITLGNMIAIEDVYKVDEKKPNINNHTSVEPNTNPDTIIESKPVNEVKPIIPSIFLNEESYNLFVSLVEYLNISISNISKRGNQARFHAIWEVSDCKKTIFKPLIPLEDYTSYLNKTFKTQYKSKSFSDGSKYHNTIRTYLTLKH